MATGRTDGERLRLFSRAVERTFQRRAVTSGSIRSRFEVTFGPEGTTVADDGSDEEDVRALLVEFRKFHAPKEDVHFYAIANIVERLAVDDEELRNLGRLRAAEWKFIDRNASVNVVLGGKAYRPIDWFDVWVNGGMFHDDPEAAAVYDSLGSELWAIGRAVVHSMVMNGLAVLDAERTLVEEGIRRGIF